MLKTLRHTLSLIVVLIVVSFAVLGCANEKTAPEKSRVVPVEDIDIPVDQLKHQGDVQKAWRVNEDLVLLEQVWHQDYNYYLLDSRTGNMEWIVTSIENARMDTITDEIIQFIAKGGSDSGNFEFPYRLLYDPVKGELNRESVFLQQDVVFGQETRDLVLTGAKAAEGQVTVDFRAADGQVLADGLKIPFTIADYEVNKLTLRIYNVTMGSYKQVLENDPLVEEINCTPLSDDEPVGYAKLLKKDFPYGGNMSENFELKAPSVLLEIKFKKAVEYNIQTATAENTATHTINVKPVDQ